MSHNDSEVSLVDQLLANPQANRELAVAEFTQTMESLLEQAFHSRPDITMADIAHELGVTESRVARIFEGEDILRFETFVRYLHVLGFRPSVTIEPV